MNYKKEFLELEKTIVKGGAVTHETAIEILSIIPEKADLELFMHQNIIKAQDKEILELEVDIGKQGMLLLVVGGLLALHFLGDILFWVFR